MRPYEFRSGLAALVAAIVLPVLAWAQDVLPSWNDGPAKQAIVRLRGQGHDAGRGFVPAAERIAVFDNDGTLWTEQPVYNQVAFTFARAAAMAPRTRPCGRAGLCGDSFRRPGGDRQAEREGPAGGWPPPSRRASPPTQHQARRTPG